MKNRTVVETAELDVYAGNVDIMKTIAVFEIRVIRSFFTFVLYVSPAWHGR